MFVCYERPPRVGEQISADNRGRTPSYDSVFKKKKIKYYTNKIHSWMSVIFNSSLPYFWIKRPIHRACKSKCEKIHVFFFNLENVPPVNNAYVSSPFGFLQSIVELIDVMSSSWMSAIALRLLWWTGFSKILMCSVEYFLKADCVDLSLQRVNR